MTGRHKRKRETTTAGYDAMLIRMLRAYRKRICQDPHIALADLRAIESELADAVNLGLHDALAAGKSPTELAAMLGVSRQAIYKRAALGEQAANREPTPITVQVARPRALPSPPTSGPGPGR